MAIPVKADAAPVPFYAVMTLWPLILAVLVVIIAIFLYRKFKK
jgi:asparagine N-glycosylation enzyme membrane subunit Stt3